MPQDNYQICNFCIMDTSDPDIIFDEKGRCNHCKAALKLLDSPPYNLPKEQKKEQLDRLVQTVRKSGEHKKYDCVIGVSGGVDSSFVAMLVKKLGLRPLAVHLDNGWDSELAVKNIENICKKLDIDLYTHVLNWEEFKDLQLSFLRASTPDSEIPSDHAIFSILYMMASKYGLKYIISGSNRATETCLPTAWSYGHWDWTYIRSLHKKFGSGKLTSFPHFGYLKFIYWRLVKKIRWISVLDYIDFDKEEAKKAIIRELDWRDYGGKHNESTYTKFYQSYILPKKFGYDKRRTHLSAIICSGRMTRDQALQEIKKPIYSESEERYEVEYICKKFDIPMEDFGKIMALPKKSHNDFPNHKKLWYYQLGLKLFRAVKPKDV